MPNRRDFDHIGSFNFEIEISGVTQGPAIHVSGLSSQTEVLSSRNGSDIIQRRRPGRSSCSNVVIQRGYTNNDELYNWYAATRAGVVERKSGSVIILGDNASEICRFNFFEAWPCRWSMLPLDAEDGEILIEEIEIAVERIEKG